MARPDDSLLAERPASQLILSWMRELRSFQKQFGSLFGRRKPPSLTDDFTAAVKARWTAAAGPQNGWQSPRPPG